MGRKKSRQGPPATDAPAAPFHNPFAGLAGVRDQLPPGEGDAAAPRGPDPDPSAASGSPAAPAGAVVRRERKGRRGKEVTLVELRGVAPAALDGWLHDAKRALGCGGAVEDGALLLQGDQRDRVRGWLTARGVERITVS